MRALLLVVMPLLLLLYPILVYFGLQHLGPSVLAGVLVIAVVVRLLLSGRPQGLKSLILPAVAIIYCFFVAFFNSDTLLKYYPVLMSLAVASAFLMSLAEPEPLLEKAAKISGKKITPKAKVYLRNLTLIWALVIASNGVVATYTACCASLAAWGLYNGLISYGVFASLFIGEWIYRQYYIRRYDSAA